MTKYERKQGIEKELPKQIFAAAEDFVAFDDFEQIKVLG